ncbi:MAG: transcriptional regulator [Actinomycetota bacterium]
MAQVSWRCGDDLVTKVRLEAALHGLSMNEFITRVLRAATDPDYEADPSDRVRERLRAAGLLSEPLTDDDPEGVDWDEVRAAGAEAARGTPLSDLVVESR